MWQAAKTRTEKMDRTEPDVLDWMNALPDETRARLFQVLGLSETFRPKEDKDSARLALARALCEAARLGRLN